GQAGAAGEESRESRPERSSPADSYSPSASNDPNARNTGGVSQNAMEFLKGQGLVKQGSRAQGNNTNPPAGNGEQGGDGPGENTNSPVGDSAQGDALEQSEQTANAGQSPGVDNTSATASNDAEAKSMDGTSQNALEFLQNAGNEGDSAAESSSDASLANNGQGNEQGEAEEPSQNTQQDSNEQQASNAPPALTSPDSGSEPEGESTSGVSQNALEFLLGEGQQQGQDQTMPADTSTPYGTLSIKDLMNAKGVGGANAAPPPPPAKPKDVQEPIETPPDKDGGGQ
ncbi:MAG: hypothetical protein GY732_02815, partial [Gammaproteobacteria bacterium]|nr:hypothetical protein [Gammaproteobacteria bacterium]